MVATVSEAPGPGGVDVIHLVGRHVSRFVEHQAVLGEAGGDEALMLDVAGNVATCNATNFFMVTGGRVWTSTGEHCLNGITRGLVIELCHAAGIPVFERDFSLGDVYAADEAFVTGTFGALTPVIEVDGQTIGGAPPGPITAQLAADYQSVLGNATHSS